MFPARLLAPQLDFSAGNVNRLALRVRGWCGIMAALCLVWLAPASVQAQTAYFSGTVSTLAGGFSELLTPGAGPASVAVDASGDVFLANPGNNTVYEIVAVNGSIPASPTINALGSGFNQPNGVAVDAKGDVFVADTFNNAVKEIVAVNGSIPASPTINTLAAANGNFSEPTGIAVDGSGNVYVANFVNGGNAVEEIMAAGGYTAVNILGSGFSYPEGVAVDASGDVFVADYDNEEVKEIVAVDGSIPVSDPTINVLGSGFYKPAGVAVDANGDVFVADSLNSEVKEIVAVDGSIPANDPTIEILGSGFSQLVGVAVDGKGDVFAADTYNDAVKEIVTAGVNFGPVAVATATPSILTLQFTFDTTVTTGTAAVLTQGATGLDFTDAGTGTCVDGTIYSAADTCTVNVKFAPKFPGPRHGAVQLLSNSGTVIATGYVDGTGTGPQINFLPGTIGTLGSGFIGPYGVAVDGRGNVYVADSGNNAVQEIMAVNGSIPASPTIETLGSGFSEPKGVAVDGSGNIFVGNEGTNTVEEIVAVNGSIPASPTIRTLGTGFSEPKGVAVDGNGNVLVADESTNTVQEIVAVSGSIPASPTIRTLGSGFSEPKGIAVDANGNIFVTNQGNNTVQEIVAVNGGIPLSPAIETLGSGFDEPGGVAVDGNGDVYVANQGNNTVQEIVAVNGSIPVSPTINTLGSSLTDPGGVAVDGKGNVFVADYGGNAVQELDHADVPALTFATSTDDGKTDTTDGALSIQIENNGNEPLTASSAGLSVSAYFTQVDGSGTPMDCSASFSLTAGASCNLSVEFAPTVPASGTVDGSVTLTDNNLNVTTPAAVQTIPLVGTVITQQASVTSLTAAPSMVDPAQAVTLLATVSAASTGMSPGFPSGTVTFYDGGAQLGEAVELAGGTAVLVAPSLPAGATAAITATYSGNNNFLGSTSSSTSVAVAPYYFTFTNTGVSEYTAAPGAAATYNFTLAPLFGSYAGPVSFAVTGLPAGATASFTPNAVATSGGKMPIAMTVETAAAVAHNRSPMGRGIVLALLLLPFGIKRSLRNRLNGGWMVLLVLLVGATGAMSGCGYSSSQQKPQVYTLTVTATSGTLTRSQAVILLVQQQ